MPWVLKHSVIVIIAGISWGTRSRPTSQGRCEYKLENRTMEAALGPHWTESQGGSEIKE